MNTTPRPMLQSQSQSQSQSQPQPQCYFQDGAKHPEPLPSGCAADEPAHARTVGSSAREAIAVVSDLLLKKQRSVSFAIDNAQRRGEMAAAMYGLDAERRLVEPDQGGEGESASLLVHCVRSGRYDLAARMLETDSPELADGNRAAFWAREAGRFALASAIDASALANAPRGCRGGASAERFWALARDGRADEALSALRPRPGAARALGSLAGLAALPNADALTAGLWPLLSLDQRTEAAWGAFAGDGAQDSQPDESATDFDAARAELIRLALADGAFAAMSLFSRVAERARAASRGGFSTERLARDGASARRFLELLRRIHPQAARELAAMLPVRLASARSPALGASRAPDGARPRRLEPGLLPARPGRFIGDPLAPSDQAKPRLRDAC